MTTQIDQILDDPEKLAAMSDSDLRALLEPFIPQTRAQVLPEDKPRKEGLAVKHMKSLVKGLSPQQLEEMLKHNKP